VEHGDFEQFAAARTPYLYRSAHALCGDAHHAEDLVQETLAAVYLRWSAGLRHPAAFAQRELVRTYAAEQRRRVPHETPHDHVPDRVVADPAEVAILRLSLQQMLTELPTTGGVVAALRYSADLSVAEVAGRLRLTPGTVRNLSSQALAHFRTRVRR
jgi:RNA polymerase sigma factor (sigma-70 family)